MKKIEKTSMEEKTFDLRHLGVQELSEEDISELREFAIAGGYQLGSILFGGLDKEILGCIPDRARAKVVNNLTKTIGFLNLEIELSNYRKQHITGSLFFQILRYGLLFCIVYCYFCDTKGNICELLYILRHYGRVFY
jgi:hypothetical protein